MAEHHGLTQCDRHEQELYRGNGKKALLVRVELMEEAINRIDKNLTWGTRLMVGMALTIAGDLIVRWLKP